MIATTLHSIAVGNLLPAWVRVVCVDINPSTAIKLADRGSFQTVGLVTDVAPFLRALVEELAVMRSSDGDGRSQRQRSVKGEWWRGAQGPNAVSGVKGEHAICPSPTCIHSHVLTSSTMTTTARHPDVSARSLRDRVRDQPLDGSPPGGRPRGWRSSSGRTCGDCWSRPGRRSSTWSRWPACPTWCSRPTRP